MLNVSASASSSNREVNAVIQEGSSAHQGGQQTIVPRHGESSPRIAPLGQAMRSRLVQALSDDEAFGKQLDEWVKVGGPGERREEAAKKILICREEKSSSLTLHYLSLQSLPACLGKMTTLSALFVDHNELEEISDELCKLTALETLYLNNNRLKKLPEEFGSFSKLTSLNLWGNKISRLPESFCQLTALEFLYSPVNELESLPENFGKLTALTSLHLQKNKLKRLPESFSNLTALADLYLLENELEKLPEGFGNLKALKVFSVECNKLERLPDGFGKLAALKYLRIFNNNIDRLPEGFGRLTSLKELLGDPDLLPPVFHEVGNIPGLLALCNTQDAERAAKRQPAITNESIEAYVQKFVATPTEQLLREEVNRLITYLHLTFASEYEKHQWQAEIGALKTHYPDTAAQALMLYSALSKSLIAQYEHAVPNASGAGVTGNEEPTSSVISLGMTVDAVGHAPHPGNQLSSAPQTVMHTAADQRVTRSIVQGLNAIASIIHAESPRARDATVRGITHALAYRLALHRCKKPEADGFDAMKQAFTTFIDTDDRNSTLSNNYAQRITDAIKSPEATFSDARGCAAPEDRLEAAATSLVAAALSGRELWNNLLPRARRESAVNAQALGVAHQDIIKKLARDTPSSAAGQAAPTWRNTAIAAHANATVEEALRRRARWVRPTRATLPALLDNLHITEPPVVRPTRATLPELLDNLHITEPPANEFISPISRHLMDKMYGSYDAQQVMDAAERLDTRTRMKKVALENAQLEDQNEQLQRTVGTLRDELHTLQSKPSDPAIGSLRSTVDTLTAQHATMQPKVSSAQRRANRAQEAVQTLTTQVQTMQTALDNTPAKERVDAIAQRVDTLDNAKENLLGSMRTIKSTATTLEGKVQALTNKASDPAIATLRSDLDRVTTQQTAMQTSVADAQRNAASAQELAQSFAQRMGTTRALVNTLERDVDALDARLANIPVQDEYDELERRITAFNDDKFDMMRTVQTMAESAALLDREVHRSILKPPDPAIAQLRRDLNAVMARQEEMQKSLAGGRRR